MTTPHRMSDADEDRDLPPEAYQEPCAFDPHDAGQDRVPARELCAIAFPECAKRCALVVMIGASECDSACPSKFNNVTKPKPCPTCDLGESGQECICTRDGLGLSFVEEINTEATQ